MRIVSCGIDVSVPASVASVDRMAYRGVATAALNRVWPEVTRSSELSDSELRYARIPTRLKLIALMSALDTEDLTGKKILEVGCGAKEVQDGRFFGFSFTYYPWLSRALTYLGSEVIGIDRCQSEGEPYHHIVGNLQTPQTFAGLEAGSFDLVCGFSIHDSPTWLRGAGHAVKAYSVVKAQAQWLLHSKGSFLWDGPIHD